MSDLFITEQGSSIHKEGESLYVRKEGKDVFEIELKNVDTIQLFGYINFSAQLAHEFMKRGIELALYTLNGELLGQITPIHVKNVALRYKQYELESNEAFKLEFAKYIVSLKFKNCINLLAEAERKREDLDIKGVIKELKSYSLTVENANSIESLLGVEGSFARKYFSLYGLLFKEAGIFNGRSKRPPRDPGNSCLSFTYTLLTNRISSHIDGIGFDPYLGFYHSMEYGRVSLACDMVEPFRPIFCDRFVLSLFNLKTLNKDDFDITDSGVFLLGDAKKKFLTAYATEILKEKNYGIVKGNFQALLNTVVDWMKKCIEAGKVIPLGDLNVNG